MNPTGPSPTSWRETEEIIKTALASNNPTKALRLLSPWITHVPTDQDNAAWKRRLVLLAQIIGARGPETLRGPAEDAAEDPEEPEPLYRLGHALIEEDLPALASGILQRAFDRAPANAAILAEWVAALELEGRNREAIEALDRIPDLVQSSALLTYLRAFNAVLDADLDTPHRLLPRLQDSSDERIVFMRERLERMLGRAEAIRGIADLSHTDLRGWYFVITGGILLHKARTKSQVGRYGKTWDSYARVLEGLQNIKTLLGIWNITVPATVHPPERNSEILAYSLSELIGVPVKKWYGDNEPGLIVIYDPAQLVPELREVPKRHAPGQLLFMHAVAHTREHRIAPDLLTYFFERNTPPWGPGFGPQDEYIERDQRPTADLVREVLVADLPASSLNDQVELVRFVDSLRQLPLELRPAALQNEGKRERLWVGSPVPRA